MTEKFRINCPDPVARVAALRDLGQKRGNLEITVRKWTDDNIEAELRRLSGELGYFPPVPFLRALRRNDLLNAVRKSGGFIAWRNRLGIPTKKAVTHFVPLSIHGRDAVVHLTKQKFAIIDLVDWDLVMAGGMWHAHRAPAPSNLYYARRIRKPIREFIHTLLLAVPPGMVVDHKDRDGLNNRRSNLRPATLSQNKSNCTRKNVNGFRGVRKQDFGGYQAMIRVKGRCYALGTHPTAEQAAIAYDGAARQHYGEFAVLNFPNEAA